MCTCVFICIYIYIYIHIQVESAITGATGSHGGKASTFCPEVFCFPTMCAKAIQNPSAANGHRQRSKGCCFFLGGEVDKTVPSGPNVKL